MANSTQTLSSEKPEKPYSDFPLYPHRTGRWAKRIRGKIHYFGSWKRAADGDWKTALDLYLQEREYLFAGRIPPRNSDGVRLKDVCNSFLTHCKRQMDLRELTLRSFVDYRRTTDRMISVWGADWPVEDLTPLDFDRLRQDIQATRGPTAYKTERARVKRVLNFAFRQGLIEKEARYGDSFNGPSAAAVRKAAPAAGSRIFTPAELRSILAACESPHVKAMVLLGVNGGVGNRDAGLLTFDAIDLDTGWLSASRNKTGVARRFPLWPETLEAIRASIATRPKPKPGCEQYVFLTRKGHSWSKDTSAAPLAREFKKALVAAGITRVGAGYYDLRRVFATVGEEVSETATKAIMAHADHTMAGRYRQGISDARLKIVTDHVRSWLFGSLTESQEITKESV